jgi:hypothetical protein
MRLISLNKLYALSGEDYLVVQDEETDEFAKNVLKRCGIFVFISLFLCWIGGIGFFAIVFHQSYILSLIIGIFWAFVITNLYVLLLSTISPIVITKRMTYSEKKNLLQSNKINIGNSEFISILIRILFMSLFAIINGVLCYLAIFEFNNRKEQLAISQEIKDGFSNNTISIFLILSISLICFITPIIIKYTLRFKSNYYQIKKRIYENLVREHYAVIMKPNFSKSFNENYKYFKENTIKEIENRTQKFVGVNFNDNIIQSTINNRRFNLDEFVNIHNPKEYFEAFEDAPFNTTPKKKNIVSPNAKFETITDLLYNSENENEDSQFGYYKTTIKEVSK